MDTGYDALDAATSSYTKSQDRHEDRYRSHRDERGDRDRDRDRERRPRDDRDRDHGREDRHRERDRGDYGRRDRDRDHGHSSRDRGDRGDRDDRRDRDRSDRYDRDRYDRDDRRRDDRGDRYGRGGGGDRDRDPYGRDQSPRRRQDRGGGGGDREWRGGGDDRRGGGQRGRGRNQSPQRSPTPPNAIPLEARSVQPSLWDIAPPQFEGISAMEAKMTGMFTYGPGRVAPPLHLSMPVGGLINPLRQTKRVYIGNITDEMTEKTLKEFYVRTLRERNLITEEGDPITVIEVNREKKYAFMEFRTPDEATAALQLDGVELDDVALTIKRPQEYVGIDPNLAFLGVTGDANNKLFVGGLPTNLSSDQVMELLKSFGELRTFNLVKEGNGSVSKGFAFAEFLDPSVTDMAIQGLNGFQLGDRSLVVQRAATTGRASASAPAVSSTAAFLAQSSILQAQEEEAPATRVMLMLNMVTTDELYDDRDYAEILEDVRDECSKFGEVEGVRIPRPVPKSTKWESSDSAAQTAEKNRRINEENGVGRVYVMYAAVEGAQTAMSALGGRQFAGRTILVASASEEDFLGPAPPPPPSPPPEDDGDAPPPPPPPM